MSKRAARADRREEIAAAGIRLIAIGGARALTHRAIDAELRLAPGSTSYYARTRKDLVGLIVQRLAARTSADMSERQLPEHLSIQDAAAAITHGLDAMMSRSDEHLTRAILNIEYRDDPDILAVLAGEPPLRPRLIAAATGLLVRLGVESPADHAEDLVTLMDALLLQRAVKNNPVNTESITLAYLTGLPQTAQ